MDERMTDVPVEGEKQATPEPAGASRSGISGTAQSYAERGREQARHFGSLARGRILRSADRQRAHLAAQLENFASTLDEVGNNLSERGLDSQQRLIAKGADMLRKRSRHLRQNSAEDLYRRLEDEARNRPGAAIAGCFALGFLVARMLRK